MNTDKTKDDATRVPIPDTWLGDLQPTRKGLGGRCWKWWLPKTLFGRILLASFLPACVIVFILMVWKG